ncbi:MAG: ABC transporter permease [Armatimonadota bacterium]
MRGLRFTLLVAVRHLVTRLRSSGLILLGVSLGVFVNTVMQSMMFGFQGEAMRIILTISPSVLVQGRELGAEREGRLYGGEAGTLYAQTRLRPVDKEKGILNYRELSQRIAAIPEVVAVAPIAQGRSLLRYGTRERGVSLIGIQADDYERVVEFRSKIEAGTVEDLVRRRQSVILGYLLAEELGIRSGDRIRMEGAEGRFADLRVVAFFRSGITAIDRSYSFVNLPVGQLLLDLPNAATDLAIKTTSNEVSTPVARRIEHVTGLEAQSWDELNANFYAIMRQQNFITLGTVAMTLLVAGFGIANGLITAVLEKRRDIGILRALGVTRAGIVSIFASEGVLIAIAGTIVGLLLAAWAIAVLDETPLAGRGGLSTADTFVMLRNPSVYLTASGFALVVSLVASLFPAFRAARYDPVEIIRTSK